MKLWKYLSVAMMAASMVAPASAQLRVSKMTAAAPLDGTEVMPISQTELSRKVTMAQITGGRFPARQQRVVGNKSSALGFGGNALTPPSPYNFTYRTTHVAPPGGINLPVARFANWRLAGGGTAPTEVAGANVITVKGAIEYPIGTLTPLTFSGSSTIAIATGQTADSDAAQLFIPGGTAWAEVENVSVTAGGSYPVGRKVIAATATALNEGYASGDTTANASQAYSSSIAALYAASSWFGSPSTFSAPAIKIEGDSIAAGLNDTTGDTFGHVGYLERALGNKYAWVSSAVSGDKLANWNANHALRAPLNEAYVDTVISEYGINDVLAGDSLATLQQRFRQLWFYYAKQGIKVYQTTITPNTTSTDLWATTAGQTPANGAKEAVRVALNNWLRTVPAPLSGIIEAADIAEGGRNTGVWTVAYGVPTADGLHPASSMYVALSAAAASVFP